MRRRQEPAVAPALTAVLALQRSAGNRAVASALGDHAAASALGGPVLQRVEGDVEELREATVPDLVRLLPPAVARLLAALPPRILRLFEQLPEPVRQRLLLAPQQTQIRILTLPVEALEVLCLLASEPAAEVEPGPEGAIVPVAGAAAGQQARGPQIPPELLEALLGRRARPFGARGGGGDAFDLSALFGGGDGAPRRRGMLAIEGLAALGPPAVVGPSPPPALLGPEPALPAPEPPSLKLFEQPGTLEHQVKTAMSRLHPRIAAATAAAARHAGWDAQLTHFQARFPRVMQMLGGDALTARLIALQDACTQCATLHDATREAADQALSGAAPSAGRLLNLLPRCEAAADAAVRIDAELAPVFADPNGAIAKGQALAALPPPIAAAIEGWGSGVLPVLRRLGPAEIHMLAGASPDAISILATMSGTQITRAVHRAPRVASCRTALATMWAGRPVANDAVFPEGTPAIIAARDEAAQIRDRAGGSDCDRVWALEAGPYATLLADINACNTRMLRMTANLTTIVNACTASPPGAAHTFRWYLDEHAKKLYNVQWARFQQLVIAFAANAPGWAPPIVRILNDAYYAYTGLDQGSPLQGVTDIPKPVPGRMPPGWGGPGKPSGARGPGTLDTVRYDAANRTGWMNHLQYLRGLTAADRHDPANQVATQLRVSGGAATPHTTDPAKLGKGGSMTFEHGHQDFKPGARRLAPGGYEYSVPGLSGARLIEVERQGTVSWYLTMTHYASYRLIVDLP